MLLCYWFKVPDTIFDTTNKQINLSNYEPIVLLMLEIVSL